MKIETAIERLEEMIDCWAFLASIDHEDPHGAELELEALRMAKRALEEKPRWIPCSERLPEMQEHNHCGSVLRESDKVLFSDYAGIHVGYCEIIKDEPIWETESGIACNTATAWMPLPEAYKES